MNGIPDDLKQRVTSRKFIGAAFLFITSIILLSLKMIDASQWVQLSLGTYGIYAGANAISKFPESKKRGEPTAGSDSL